MGSSSKNEHRASIHLNGVTRARGCQDGMFAQSGWAHTALYKSNDLSDYPLAQTADREILLQNFFYWYIFATKNCYGSGNPQKFLNRKLPGHIKFHLKKFCGNHDFKNKFFLIYDTNQLTIAGSLHSTINMLLNRVTKLGTEGAVMEISYSIPHQFSRRQGLNTTDLYCSTCTLSATAMSVYEWSAEAEASTSHSQVTFMNTSQGKWRWCTDSLMHTHTHKNRRRVLTSRLAWKRSALSSTHWVRSQWERLQKRRFEHLKLMFLRSRLDRSTPSKLIPCIPHRVITNNSRSGQQWYHLIG